MDIRIGTFNILDPRYAIVHNEPAGLQHPWPQRAIFMAQFLQQVNLDILCLQEISPESLKDLQPYFQAQGYAIEYIKHPGAPPHSRHDGLAILYKTAQFAKKSFHTLSKYKLSSCFLDLQNTEGKVIRIANCHLQGGPQGPTQGYEQLQQLQQAVDQQDSSVVARILVGDFNEDEKNLSSPSSKLSILQNAQYQFDGNLAPTEPSKNRRIDWIWVKSPQAQLTPLPILPSSQPISDHLLTATHIHIPVSQQPPSPSPIQAAHPAPPARKPSFFSSLLGKVKSLFTRFLTFFKRLFNRSAV